MEVYFRAFVMAVMILGLGAGASLLEGIRTIHHAEPVSHLVLSYGVLALAAGSSWVSSVRALNRQRGKYGMFAASDCRFAAGA